MSPSDDALPLVLLVEDERVVREHLVHALSDEFLMEGAASAEDALKAILRRRPDLVVTDIVLPGMDGMELVQTLRNTPSTASIPILMMSGKSAEELRSGFEFGADAYLGKPYTEGELRVRIRGMIRNAKLRSDLVRREEQSKAELRAVRERADLLESITDAFYAVDRNWRVTYANQKALDYFRTTREDFIGKVLWDVLPQARGSVAHREYERAVQEQAPVSFEFVSPVSDRWVDVHAYPNERGLAVHFRDITHRKLADERIRESEMRFRSMADNAPVMVWVTEADGSCSFLSKSWYEFTGRTPEVALGFGWLQALHPEDIAMAERSYLEANRSHKAFRIEYRLRRADGSYAWALDAAQPRLDPTGRFLGYVGSVLDIQERKEWEQKLRSWNESLERQVVDMKAERQLFADVVEGTDAFVQLVDQNFRWLAINRSSADEFERIYAIRPKVGESMLDALADKPEHQAAVRAVWARALAGEEFTEIAEFGDPSRDRRFYEMKYNSLRDKEGRLIGAYQFTYDVTERISDQTKLSEARDALRQSQKMETLGQLTGGVAHDFNNLLTPIVGALDILSREHRDDVRLQRLTAGALQAADRAKILIQRLLAFSRRQHLHTQAVDIGALLTGIRDLLRRTLGPHIAFSMQFSEVMQRASVDPNQLELAMLNLAVNARDAMPKGGTLIVHAYEDAVSQSARLAPGRYVRIDVKDSGCGMNEETLRRAIEPFFTTKDVGQGTGLGLSMVHGLAAQLGGDFVLESTPNQGTLASLWLPVASDAVPASTVEEAPAPQTSQSAETILLVDDEPLVRFGTSAMLADAGYNVIEADTAEAAIDLVDDGMKIDLLITDFAMPAMNGVQLAAELRKRNPTLPILMITGFSSLTDSDANGLPRLAKPFRQTELIAHVAEVLATKAVA
ncbi:MAG TPA: response regulator [Steroidobacter sp.]